MEEIRIRNLEEEAKHGISFMLSPEQMERFDFKSQTPFLVITREGKMLFSEEAKQKNSEVLAQAFIELIENCFYQMDNKKWVLNHNATVTSTEE